MDISALFTSAGINTAVSVGAFSLYSVLRKQPSLISVYFGQRLSQERTNRHGNNFCFERLVPSASWIVKAWEASEDELYAAGGLDAVVFLRIVIFSIRVFSIAAIICLSLVLPFNYFGQELQHKRIAHEQTSVFTTENLKEGKWVWAHCVALYVITCGACFFLHLEWKNITKMRLAHITESLSNPSYFTVLVRGIPWSGEESYSDIIEKFFIDYYSSTYLSHQMVYQSGTVQKLMDDAEKMCDILKALSPQPNCGRTFMRCGFCGGSATSFKILTSESQHKKGRSDFGGSDLRQKECPAAFVFFRTRYAALVASQVLQSPNPMSWVIDPAPEPCDIYWANLCLPYRILWIRRTAILAASIVFVFFFLGPVSLTQSLVHIEKLQQAFPFMREVLKRKFMVQLVSGYLPSVILMLFSYAAPPLMYLFSTLEGSISRSGRKRSACVKLIYFFFWNVFFGNLVSGTVLERFDSKLSKLSELSNLKEIPNLLGKALPSQANFFMTLVMTSGWASLSCELLQPFPLLCNLFYRFILRNKDTSSYGTFTFPYHTEVPRVLLFGLVGFSSSIFAPLVLPFLLLYFLLAYLVYRNQLLNVYETKYQSGGLYWPIVHNATIFSMVLTQLIALGVFGLKKSTVASGFTIPLIICTLLFNEYCRQRFHPLFNKNPAQMLIRMDSEDEQYRKLEEIYEKLPAAYCQFTSTSLTLGRQVSLHNSENVDVVTLQDFEKTPGRRSPLHPLGIEERRRSGRRSPLRPLEEIEEMHAGRRSPLRAFEEIDEMHTGRRFPLRAFEEIEETHTGRRSPLRAFEELEEMHAGRRSPLRAFEEIEEMNAVMKSGRRSSLPTSEDIEELHASRRTSKLP